MSWKVLETDLSHLNIIRAMIEKMATATALRGSNDLGRSWTPSFLSRNRFYLQLSTYCPKMNKKFKISVLWTSNAAILRLQGA